MTAPTLSVAIPTYRREHVLVETIERVLALDPAPCEVLVIDQTADHLREVADRLSDLNKAGAIRWIRRSAPSIPTAMNHALRAARAPVVLFLDDDVVPTPELISAHLAALRDTGAALVAGRVVQPWHEGVDLSADPTFHFASLRPAWPGEFMGGNFSVRTDVALAVGGFDENFVRVAYRFESEFAHRLVGAGHRIYFEPQASVRHLKTRSGGARTFGEHLRTAKPHHAVGEYYFILRTRQGWRRLWEVARRPARAVATRHHLRRPWWIPVTAMAEAQALAWALALAARGPRLGVAPSRSSDA